MKEELGIDLAEWDNYEPKAEMTGPDMRKKIDEYVDELDIEIKRCEKLVMEHIQHENKSIDAEIEYQKLMARVEALTEVKYDLAGRMVESI